MAEQSSPTGYVILQKDGTGWKEVGNVEARSRNEAIKNAIEDAPQSMTGSFKAVPTRSWELTVNVSTETRTVVKFSESKNGFADSERAVAETV